MEGSPVVTFLVQMRKQAQEAKWLGQGHIVKGRDRV